MLQLIVIVLLDDNDERYKFNINSICRLGLANYP